MKFYFIWEDLVHFSTDVRLNWRQHQEEDWLFYLQITRVIDTAMKILP